MALDTRDGKHMPQEPTKKTSTQRVRKKSVRRKKKVATAGSIGTTPQAEADNRPKVTAVTQLDVSEVSRALPEADSAARADVAGVRPVRTKRAESTGKKTTQTSAASKKKVTRKTSTTKRKDRAGRSRQADKPVRQATDGDGATAIERPQPLTKHGESGTEIRPLPATLDKRKPEDVPTTISKPQARSGRTRRGVRRGRQTPASETQLEAAPGAIEKAAPPRRGKSTVKPVVALEKTPPESSHGEVSGEKGESGVAVVESPARERESPPGRHPKAGRARRGLRTR